MSYPHLARRNGAASAGVLIGAMGLALVPIGGVAAPAHAAIPPLSAYSFQLQARAATGGSAFNLPAGSSFTSISPQINDAGTVSFRVQTVGGTFDPGSGESRYGIWRGARGSGGVVALGDLGALVTNDTHMNQAGAIVWTQGLSGADGVYRYDPGSGTSSRVINGPAGATSWTPKINNAGQIGSRTGYGGNSQQYISYTLPSGNAVHASSVDADLSAPYSFLFSMAFDDSRRIAGVVRVGPAGSATDSTRPDQLRRFNSDGSSLLLTEDQDSNPLAPFNAFDSTTPGMSDDGSKVAFIARTTSSSATRGVHLWDNGAVIPIALPGGGINSVDNFSANVNDNGLVVFRATDTSGNISVFLGDGSGVQRMLGVGDTIMTDLGPRTITFLAGNPDINNSGEIAFAAQLNNGGNVVIAAYIPEPASFGAAAMLAVAIVRRRRAR